MQEKPDQENIVEDFPYLSELMQAVAAVRHSIEQGKDGVEAAENLLSEIPDDWTKEIQDGINEKVKAYNLVLSLQNRFLAIGYTASQKYAAEKAIHNAGKAYSRGIVKTAISLFKKKDMLFKTKKDVERGSLSIYALGEGEQDD